MQRPGSASSSPPSAGSGKTGSPWPYTHTGPHELSVTAAGAVFKRTGWAPNPSGSGGGKRGKVTGLSKGTAARLRRWLITQYVPLTSPDGRVFEVTLTIPGEVSVDEWHAARNKWRKRLTRAGCAATTRVELQKRKQPHLHAIVYLPEGTPEQWLSLTVETWLECLPERCRDHNGAKAHAFQAKPALMFEGALVPDEAWLRYLVGHQSKRKASQLGWKGKQWAVINRKLFRPLPAEVLRLYDFEVPLLNRLRRRWLRSKLGRSRFAAFHGQNGWAMVCSPAAVRKFGVWILRQRHRLDDRGQRGRYLSKPPLRYALRK